MVTQHRAHHNRGQYADHGRHAQGADHGEYGETAHHDNIPVGKIQHPGNAVYHSIAQGNDRIDAAQADSADQIRKKTHESTPSSTKNK